MADRWSRTIGQALPRGVSIPVQQSPRKSCLLQRDSRVLRHEHWRMSQLFENVASEPIQLKLPLLFRDMRLRSKRIATTTPCTVMTKPNDEVIGGHRSEEHTSELQS